MNTQSGNAHLHNMWGEIALITDSHHQQFRSGSHALFCSRNIGNIQRAIRILAGSSKTDSRNLDIHISGRTYSHPHDHEKEIRSPISVQLHSWFRIWQDAGYP